MTPTPTTSAEAGDAVKLPELPELPEAKVIVRDTDEEPEGGGWIVDCDCEGPLSHSLEANDVLYTEDQMREYASAALSAQAERVRVLEEVLRELYEAMTATFPPARAGSEAQDAWSERRFCALQEARAALSSTTGSAALTEGGGNAD